MQQPTVTRVFTLKEDLQHLIGSDEKVTRISFQTLAVDPMTSTFYIATWMSLDDGSKACEGGMWDGYSLINRIPVKNFFKRMDISGVVQKCIPNCPPGVADIIATFCTALEPIADDAPKCNIYGQQISKMADHHPKSDEPRLWYVTTHDEVGVIDVPHDKAWPMLELKAKKEREQGCGAAAAMQRRPRIFRQIAVFQSDDGKETFRYLMDGTEKGYTIGEFTPPAQKDNRKKRSCWKMTDP